MNTFTKDNYIHFKNLYISENENYAIYLGYKMNLTHSEYLILKTISKNCGKPISADEISEKTGTEFSKENIAFHVYNINKKAKLISNRIFIKNISKIGYFLN